jgi:hypothetical protein
MSEILVIKQIQMSHDGPRNEEGEQIHLQQGSLDGACGPYCLFMSLIICGTVDSKKLKSLDHIRKNTATGKTLIKMEELASESGSLFRWGTELSHLKEMAESHGYIATECQEAIRNHKNSKAYKITKKELSTDNVKTFVIDHVLQDHPVILWLDFGEKNGAHWVVVIGLEYKDAIARKNNKASRFLLLDPGSTSPIVSAWNGAIRISSRSESHLLENFDNKHNVKFHRALAIMLA